MLSDPAEVEAFFDEMIGSQLEERRIVGAVVTAVHEGRPVLMKGYGYSDRTTQTPVDPERSVFFVASISKTFLGTAVMQLVDRGRIGLDDPVAKLIQSFDLRSRFPEPVRVRHLLTHRSGYPDRLVGSSVSSEEDFITAEQSLGLLQTPQRAPPDEITTYCNFGIALLAVVVQDVTGVEYTDYLRQEILRPLGMHATGLPLPSNRDAERMQGEFVTIYDYDDDLAEFVVMAPMIRLLYPNGGMASTGADMARYMMMHLGNGAYGDARILSPEAAADMQVPHGRQHPKVPAYGWSFKESERNGVRYFGHSGDYRGTSSQMTLLPDHDFGFFVSYTGGNSTYHRHVLNTLIDRLSGPEKPSDLEPISASKEALDRYVGDYGNVRHHVESAMAFLFQLMGSFRIEATDDGVLRLIVPSFYFGGGTVSYVEVEPGLFRKVDSGDPAGIGPHLVDHLAFTEDEDGDVKYFTSTINNHPFSGRRLAWYEQRSVFMLMLAGSMLTFVVVALTLPVVWLVRATRTRSISAPTDLGGWARLCGWLLSACSVLFVSGFLTRLQSGHSWDFLFGFPHMGLSSLFVLPLLSVAFTLMALIFAGTLWRRRLGPLSCRVAYSLVPLAGLAYAHIAYNYNLLNYFWTWQGIP